VVLIVGAALSVGVFFVGCYITRDTTESQSHKKSIAVLPFENLSEEQKRELFCRRYPGSNPDEAREHRRSQGYLPYVYREVQEQAGRS
jgi:hypothetical protein